MMVQKNQHLGQVKRSLIDRENFIKNSEFEDSLTEKLFEVEKNIILELLHL
ncbi:MAG: hypothetical protein JJT76_19660 [Clostridiaceae bacterium]|nr:hypothetical protein [Clostridiaceae bacterium]